jgi:heat shock protein HtpX
MAIGAVGLTTQILNNHIKSVLLLAGFPVLLLVMMFSFFAVLEYGASSHVPLMNTYAGYARVPDTVLGAWDRAVDAGWNAVAQYGHWAFLAAAIWFTIAYFFHGRMMRMATGSVPVTRKQMPRIYNLLENMCISRGIPMPQFEVIDSPALNAFASGISDDTYKIVLTRGIIERLSEDELEAVIAHELTHIVNRDVRLLVISIIFVGMISFFCEMSWRGLRHGLRPNLYARRDRDGGGTIIVMLTGVAILAIGYFFALLIRFAISRRREFMADAGAVELTKNPEAMMRALQRISGNDVVSAMPDEVQQMCIVNSHAFMGLFATHPPIEKRIEMISQMTRTAVPEQQVSLKRGPRRPWGSAGAPPDSGLYG